MNNEEDLDLTGRVARTGQSFEYSGDCSYVWEGELGDEKVAVKVIREPVTGTILKILHEVRRLA